MQGAARTLLDEPVIIVESVDGPISGFVNRDELKEEPSGWASVQGIVRRVGSGDREKD